MAKTIHIAPRALWRREGEGVVILEEVSGEPYHLDAVGAFLFEALQRGPSFEELVAAALAAFEGDEGTVREDVELFLTALHELQLIEVRE